MFKIQLNRTPDKNLFAQFPNDECWNLQIFTGSKTLRLNRSYLELESEYFRKIPESSNSRNFSDMPEASLIAVIKGLYGDELFVTSLTELEEIYQIIEFLQIQEYKLNVQSELLSLKGQNDNAVFGSIELLEFSLNHGVLVKYITDFHFSTNLQFLGSKRSYLSLIKLSEEHMNRILIGFHCKEGERSEQIINFILQNYLNRKERRPVVYFADESVSLLKAIWEKYHHKLPAKRMTTSATTFPRLPNLEVKTSEIFSTGVIQTNKSPKNDCKDEDLDQRISELMRTLEIKNRKVELLKEELNRLKIQGTSLSRKEEDQDESVINAVKKSIRFRNQGFQLDDIDQSSKPSFLNNARTASKKY